MTEVTSAGPKNAFGRHSIFFLSPFPSLTRSRLPSPRDMFANDQRFSHVFDGAFTVKSKSQQVVDMDKMAAQAKAFAAARAKAETEGKASIGDPAAGASGDKRKRVGEDQGASAKKVAASKGEDRPPFALKPSDEALLKRITAVATMVAKNGQKFEDITRQKNAERRDEFSFLFGGEGEDYYLWLRYATKAGLNPDAPPGATPGFDPVALAEAARKIAEAAAATAPASGSPLASAATTAASTGLTAADWKEKSAATVAAPSQAFPPPVKPVSQGTWQAVKDAVGRTYYWNKVTNATTWDPPPGM